MGNKLTNKEKEIFFRLAYNQYQEWKQKPDDLKNILDRMGIYMTLFSQFENRVRVLYWTTVFNEPFLYPDRRGDMVPLTKGEFNYIIEDPYPPNAPSHVTLGAMNTSLVQNKVIAQRFFEQSQKNIYFRNELNHQFFLKQHTLQDEHIGDVVESFRYFDKRLKQKRSVYKKRRGNRRLESKRRVIRFQKPTQ